MTCNHVRLQKCKIGETPFYKCESCGQNFRVPEALMIEFTYPQAEKDKE